MPYIPNACTHCGANLDTGERCDCADDDFMEAVQRAAVKLQRIIKCEGDLDGYRLTQEYLNQLILEEMRAIRAEQEFGVERLLCMVHAA